MNILKRFKDDTNFILNNTTPQYTHKYVDLLKALDGSAVQQQKYN